MIFASGETRALPKAAGSASLCCGAGAGLTEQPPLFSAATERGLGERDGKRLRGKKEQDATGMLIRIPGELKLDLGERECTSDKPWEQAAAS